MVAPAGCRYDGPGGKSLPRMVRGVGAMAVIEDRVSRPPDRGAPGERFGGAALAVIALGTLLIAAALLWRAVEVERFDSAFQPPGRAGSLQSVQLTDGLVFYGMLESVRPGTVLLDHVYEVQTAAQAGQVPPQTRLVRRHSQDWHGPGMMAIPTERILFMEAVPPGSEVEKRITADEKHP
jgi:hypothetical protein